MTTAIVVALLGLLGTVIGILLSILPKRIAIIISCVLVAAIVVILAMVFTLRAINQSPEDETTRSGDSVSESPSLSDGPTHAPSGISERADNRAGSPVFADPAGAAPPQNIPQRIPFGTKVLVKCYEQNQSGMTSVTAFYLISGSQWDGMYSVSDTFTNGDPFGAPGSTSLDPRIPAC